MIARSLLHRACSLILDAATRCRCRRYTQVHHFIVFFRLAKLAVDKVITAPCETSILYPKHGGNLHCFTAITPCAVLDILSPSYREDEGRKCTYYHDYSYSTIYR
ncbi:hypothetical protein HN51_052297 [Arachis hypogaea]